MGTNLGNQPHKQDANTEIHETTRNISSYFVESFPAQDTKTFGPHHAEIGASANSLVRKLNEFAALDAPSQPT